MTPYTKKIVELHKIHKAIEDKDCCNGGGSTPSGDITIDDVVKFIHDNNEGLVFNVPTKYDDIPNIPDNFESNKIYIVKGTSEEFNELNSSVYNIEYILSTRNYNIAIVNVNTVPVG